MISHSIVLVSCDLSFNHSLADVSRVVTYIKFSLSCTYRLPFRGDCGFDLVFEPDVSLWTV